MKMILSKERRTTYTMTFADLDDIEAPKDAVLFIAHDHLVTEYLEAQAEWAMVQTNLHAIFRGKAQA